MLRYFFLFFVFLSALKPQEKNLEEVHLNLALSLLQEDRIIEALETLKDFVELYPDSPLLNQAYETIAEIHKERREYVLAGKIYEKLAERVGINQLGLSYLFKAAQLKRKLGNTQDALKIYQQIIFLSPNSPIAYEAEEELKFIGFTQNLHME